MSDVREYRVKHSVVKAMRYEGDFDLSFLLPDEQVRMSINGKSVIITETATDTCIAFVHPGTWLVRKDGPIAQMDDEEFHRIYEEQSTTDLKWDEGYDGTKWFSNGAFHVVGAFEDSERLGSPYLYYVVTDVDWDEANTVGDGLKTPEEAIALAQRLQNAFDGVSPAPLTKESLNQLIEEIEANTMWDVRDAVGFGAGKLRDAIIARQVR